MSQKYKYYLALSFIILFCTSVFSSYYTLNSIPNYKERDANSFVSNPDGIINKETETEINKKLLQLEKDLSVEVAVVLVNSIGDEDIKTFGVELFNKWGIGKAQSDNGLLVLFVLDQRKVSFEIGYGLEGSIPDAISKRIQTKYMMPKFKEGNYNEGILAGVEQIILRIQKEGDYDNIAETEISISTTAIIGLSIFTLLIFTVPLWKLAKKTEKESAAKTNINFYRKFNEAKKTTSSLSVFLLLVLFAFLVFFGTAYLNLFTMLCYFLTLPVLWFLKVSYGNYLSGKIKKIPIKCNVCSSEMQMLSDKEKDINLSPKELLENKLKSAYHDVYLCKNCQNREVLSYENTNSPYKRCPNCQCKAFIVKNRKIVLQPTYASTGKEVLTSVCQFCNFSDKSTRTISKRVRAVASPGRSFPSGGGRSSGGSFGGGRTGGGGSVSRW